jgi:predicted patatin/cPLA2 family phospholipase
MMDTFQESMSLLFDHMPSRDKKFRKLDEGDLNRWILNRAMAPNPFVRYFTSMMYLSNVTGLSRINYPDSDFMKGIKFENLFERKRLDDKNKEKEQKEMKPFIFHNAWNLDKRELALFSNRRMNDEAYQGDINATTLCACSALPFIEETVKIGGDTYCEGALVDTVNFRSLIEEHGNELDEIWVSRIVDSTQIRKPENLHDSLANLCQLFAATVGEDDVKLFKYHLKEENRWPGTVVEIQVPRHINFKWNYSNLDQGRREGKAAAEKAYAAYEAAGGGIKKEKLRFINERKDEKKGQHLDKDRLANAIAQAKGTRDPKPWLAKMELQVDAKTGKKVEPDEKGKYRKGSLPYPGFAMRNPMVKELYDRLGESDPSLDKL